MMTWTPTRRLMVRNCCLRMTLISTTLRRDWSLTSKIRMTRRWSHIEKEGICPDLVDRLQILSLTSDQLESIAVQRLNNVPLEQLTQTLNLLKINDDIGTDSDMLNQVREPESLLSINPPVPSTNAIQVTPDADSTPMCRRRSFRVVSNLKFSFNKKSTYLSYSRSLPTSKPQADHDTSSSTEDWLLGRLGERLKEKMALSTRRPTKQRTKRRRTHDHMPASLETKVIPSDD
jgi:hypothetical protein